MATENELVSKGYLTIFFMDIDQLRNSLTGYRSMILRLNIDTTKKLDEEVITKKLDDQTKNALIQWSDAVRNNVERCHISYNALTETIPKIKSEILNQLYEEIIKVFSPDVDTVAKYAFEIHKCFIKGTLHEIMNTMDDFYKQYTQ